MYNVDALKALSTRHISMFSEAIMAAPFPDNFKMLSITPYDGKGDLATYVEVFERVSELAKCQAFPLTLLVLVQSWHNRLISRSIVLLSNTYSYSSPFFGH